MEFTQRNFASVGLLLFAVVGCSLILQMPSLAVAALSCDPSTEVYVGGNQTSTINDGGKSCKQCPYRIQALCYSKGSRAVSKFECNWWDTGIERTTVCVGCCGAPLPSPPPIITDKCQAGDADLSFLTPISDCGKCQNGCTKKCEMRNEMVSREMCLVAWPNYNCNCCCRPPPSPTANANFLSFIME